MKDGQAECTLCDEVVAPDRLERGREAIINDLVITGGHPDFTIHFNADLRGAGHVARRMEGHGCPTDGTLFAISDPLGHDITQAVAHNRQCIMGGQISAHTPTGMIRVTVRDKRTVYAPPRINVEIAGRAIDAFGGECQDGITVHGYQSSGQSVQGQT